MPSKTEKDLKEFKEHFIKDYISNHLNQLLDLRNAIQKANSFDEIRNLMEKEQDSIKTEFNLVFKETKKET